MEAMRGAEIAHILGVRRRARRDLLFLAREVLGYDRMVERVHSPMARFLTQFPEQGEDLWHPDVGFIYKPLAHDPAEVLKDPYRRRLLLAPRGWFKTTLNVVSHTIQWLLNFPDVTILWVHGSQEIMQFVFSVLRHHFYHNERFRYYFPDYCPTEPGTSTWFNLPNRTVKTAAPSVSIAGIESIRTGMHYHVMKFTDIVDEKNSARPELCRKIIEAYAMAENLLMAPNYWIDIEGTIYSYADLHAQLVDQWREEERRGLPHTFQIFLMSCYERDVPGGQTFTPKDLDYPFKLDENGNKISLFPELVTTEQLEELRKHPIRGVHFAAQQLNDPVGSDEAEQVFPPKFIHWKSTEELARIPIRYKTITVDTAHSSSPSASFSVITTCGWDRLQRCYVLDVRLGRWQPEQLIQEIISAVIRHRPVRLIIEDTGFVRGLVPALRREAQQQDTYLPLSLLKRGTDKSKEDRIRALRPWFEKGMIFFSDSLPEYVKEHIINELTRFPKYQFKDFLDTLADQFLAKIDFAVEPKTDNGQTINYARHLAHTRPELWQELFGLNDVEDQDRTGLLR